MYDELAVALAAVNADPKVRCVLLCGEGDSFTAGNDIADFESTTDPNETLSHPARFIKALAAVEKPVVVAVQGAAVGIGTTMLLHCDVVCVAEDAKLIAPFVTLGLVPEAGASRLLPARIGHIRAFAMFSLGRAISGVDAAAWGLATVAVRPARLQAEAREIATVLAKRAPSALRGTKALMLGDAAIFEVIDKELAEYVERLSSPETKEAFTAFREKRAPDFTNFD